MKNTLIINLLSQPHVNRSIISSYVTTQLKMMGIECECVGVWTKGLVENDKSYMNPLYIVGKQSYEVSKLIGDVDVIINEYPLIDYILRVDENSYLNTCIMEHFLGYGENNLNIYLNSFEEDNNDKERMFGLWNGICERMGVSNIQMIDMDASIDGCNRIVELIGKIFGYIENNG